METPSGWKNNQRRIGFTVQAGTAPSRPQFPPEPVLEGRTLKLTANQEVSSAGLELQISFLVGLKEANLFTG